MLLRSERVHEATWNIKNETSVLASTYGRVFETSQLLIIIIIIMIIIIIIIIIIAIDKNMALHHEIHYSYAFVSYDYNYKHQTNLKACGKLSSSSSRRFYDET